MRYNQLVKTYQSSSNLIKWLSFDIFFKNCYLLFFSLFLKDNELFNVYLNNGKD